MNKLLTQIYAGIGFEWDDFRFEQDAIRVDFHGLVSALGISPSQSFIISGCQITGSAPTQTYAPGYISLNGEILKVDGGSVPVIVSVGDVQYWDVDITYDPSGFENFENATSGDTYQVRKGVLRVGPPPVDYMPITADTFATRITKIVDQNLPAINATFRPFKLIQGDSVAPVDEPNYIDTRYSPVASHEPHYKVDSLGQVHIKGRFTTLLANSFDLIILPFNLQPSRWCYGIANIFNSSGLYQRSYAVAVNPFGTTPVLRFPQASGNTYPAVGEVVEFTIVYPLV